MTISVTMPALSPTMTEGKLAAWHKKVGDDVAPGDVIAEIETDKATMEVEAVDEGRLGKIVVDEGTEGVAVNSVIAILLEEGEDDSALDSVDLGGGGGTAEPEAQAGREAAAPKADAAAAAPAPTASSGGGEGAKAPSGGGEDRIFVSPLARRMATQAGLDLAGIDGSGPHGRIVKRDVEAALERKPAGKAAPAAAEKAAPVAPSAAAVDLPGLPGYTEHPNSAMRKIIARRLQESKLSAPHFYLTIDCEIDALLDLRKQLNAKSDAYKLSVNDILIKATAMALKKVPAANATWTDEAIRIYDRVDVSVAVAIDGGLITPIIHDTAAKGFVEISAEMKDLAKRAREGKLKPEEFQGGTFSISNLGMFGIREFAAVINPPQGAILAIGKGEPRPVVKDGALAIATMMSCTLSVDHRVVDGAVGAEFLAAFKALVEDPLTMLL